MDIREKVKELPRKYQIGKRPLSRILGWGELTYTRILEGARPTAQHEAELLRALNEPLTYIMLLDQAHDAGLVSDTSYKRSRAAAEEHLKDDETADSTLKLHAVATRLCTLAKGDITPHALQILVYYVHGSSLASLKKPLIDQQPIAADAGPVYEAIDAWFTYDRIQEIAQAAEKAKEAIETEEAKSLAESEKPQALEVKQPVLSSKEIALVDSVYKKYGIYSGSKLGDMACDESPWKKTRKRAAREETAANTAVISEKAMSKFFSKK